MVEYGEQESRWDLRVLLYRGAAKAHPHRVFNQIAVGEFGKPLVERLELLIRIHEAMTGQLVSGSRKSTAYGYLKSLRIFFTWADEFEQTISLDTVENTFRHWSDDLVNRVRFRSIKNNTAHTLGSKLASILDKALERRQPLISTTRLRKTKRGPRAVGVAADKENLSNTFSFGRLCLDIIDSLPVEVVLGPLPAILRLRDGRTLEQWSGLREPATVAALQSGYKNQNNARKVIQLRADKGLDLTLNTRSPLVNLRITAEVMVFISQTGMNLAQVLELRRTDYSYKSTIDGYEVRRYKARRQGEVLFEIFNDYKAVFDAYVAWRDAIFSNTTDRLFPFVRRWGALASSPPTFDRLRYSICAPLGITFVGPQRLRNTRVNWLLRESRNPELTAEQTQHTTQTLLSVYEKPSLQVAQVELIQFWQKNDPRLADTPMPCTALGVCDGVPTPTTGLPQGAPKADCRQPSGCLFCEHHRDIDSEDYVWSLASMRFLNSVILQRFRPQTRDKADAAAHVELTLEVLTAKLKWFSESNAPRKAWVEEANEKLNEGEYHLHWHYLIESAQGVGT
jgi:hypothetical protein